MSAVPPPSAHVGSSNSLTVDRVSLDALTGIRFFAASYVILFHTKFALEARARHHGPIDRFVDGGFLAVTLFFMLSGFILAYTYSGRIRNGNDRLRFWEARFARLWPLYALSLAFMTLVAPSTVPPAGQAATVLLMLQAWNPLNVIGAENWNTVCWTLSVEAFFYLLFPFIQPAMQRLTRRGKWLGLVVTVAVAVYWNVASGTVHYDQLSGLARDVPFAIIHVPEFIAGVWVGMLFNASLHDAHGQVARSTAENLSANACTWSGLVLSLLMLGYRSDRWTSLIVVPFGLLLYGLSSERTPVSRLLSWRPLVIGGQISYAMYLFHLPLKLAVSRFYDEHGVTSPMLRFATLYFGVIALSALLFSGFETPVRKAIRRGFLRLQPAP